MTAIKKMLIPKTPQGNDPNDQKDDPEYLKKLKSVNIDTEKSVKKPSPDTEDDIGLIFSEKYGEKLRYVAQMGRWFLWEQLVTSAKLLRGQFDLTLFSSSS